jgi:tRNA-dependent cyclodipeptide synthase
MNVSNNTLPIVGISPRNAYYADPDNIRFALDTVLRDYGMAYVMIPDVPDINNYLAYGYSENTAQRNAQRDSGALKSNIRDICDGRGYSYSDTGHSSAQVRIIDWAKDVELHPAYKEKRDAIGALYDNNAAFRQAAWETTQRALETRIAHNSEAKKRIQKTGIDKAVDKAVGYVLSEIAFLEAVPVIFNGCRVEYAYHRNWEIFEKLINGRYGNERPENLGFRLIKRGGIEPR